MVVAFGDDSHRGFDPLDHHIEVAARRLVLFAETSIESFVHAIESFVYAIESSYVIEPFVYASEPFVDDDETLLDGVQSFVDIPEALGNVPAQLLDRHEHLHPTIVKATC